MFNATIQLFSAQWCAAGRRAFGSVPAIGTTACLVPLLAQAASAQNFGGQQVISSIGSPISVCTADLDGDGDQDVVATTWQSLDYGLGQILWHQNLGGGSFGPKQEIDAFTGGGVATAADLDNDGDQDLLTTRVGGSVQGSELNWYENKGPVGGTLGNPLTEFCEDEITGGVSLPASVYAADLDGDGYKDVLSASFDLDRIYWNPSNGLNTANAIPFFSIEYEPQLIGAHAAGPRSVYATDLDGDGDQDVLSASESDDKIAWYENQGGGSFGAQQVITTSADGARSVYATDLDGDGDQDVLSASFDDDKIAWYPNLGGGSFGPQQVITVLADGAMRVYTADLDGDGDQDVLSASESDDKIAWYENLGDCSFGPQQVITTSADGAQSVYATDLDGDGDQDVLSVSAEDGKLAWYENLGSFATQSAITTSANGAQSVYATDLDSDGDQDVLSASYNDDTIAWYPNLGGGSFGSQQVITTSADGAFSVHSTDLDGDGDQDVLSASAFDDKIAWYENLGGGSFGPQLVITTSADFAQSVYATDLDGDGDQDVLSASLGDGKIAWYPNQGGGSFGSQQVITSSADGAQSVYATDVDGDGDQDVLSASQFDRKIAWYQNLGGGSFGSQQVITTNASGASSVYATDLDGDGDQDVLSASQLDNKTAWYENLGGGSFGPQKRITTSADQASLAQARSVYAADLDGDGDQDVLSASFLDDKITWYKNLIPSAPLIPAPANDTCATPDVALTGTTAWDNTWATTTCFDGGDPVNCMSAVNGDFTPQGQSHNDLFWTFTIPCNGIWIFDTLGSPVVQDTRLSLHLGSDCTATCVQSNDNEPGGSFLSESLLVGAVAGAEYLVQVGTWSSGATTGVGVLNITRFLGDCPPPVNDTCATPDVALTGTTAWDNTSATTTGFDGGDPVNCMSPANADTNPLGQAHNDLFWTFTIPCDGDWVFDTLGSPVVIDTRLSLHLGSDCTATCVQSNDDEPGGSFLSESILVGAVAGDEYLIQVGTFTAGDITGAGVLNITRVGGDCTAPVNILCDPASDHYAGDYAKLGTSYLGSGVGSDLHLECTDGPAGEFGFFLMSFDGAASTAAFNGVLCLGSPSGRYNAQIATNQGLPQLNSIGQFDAAGVLQNLVGTGASTGGSGFDVPLELPFSPAGQVINSGDVVYFQLWYRDQVPPLPNPGSSANFSNMIEVTFP